MDSLGLKLALTPALIGGASLAARRWGPAVSGWLVGLPFTSGTIAFFIALSHSAAFTAAVAVGTLAGTISQAGFCLAYGWTARRWGWPGSILAGSVAFGVATIILRPLALPLTLVFLAVIAALGLAIRLMPPNSAASGSGVAPPWWDIPARMVVATAFVLLLTGIAPVFGPHLTGLLAPFPLYATVLTVFAHHFQGSSGATAVLRGLLLGLFAFAAFFVVLALLLTRVDIAGAFGAAAGSALGIQAGSLIILHRGHAL